MLVIDQHALHERILYEDLLTRLTRGPLESQRMLIPLTLRANPRQIDLLEQIRPLLARIGIEAEPFGPDAVAVHAFPSFLDRLDPVVFVAELLEKGEADRLDLHEEELLHDVLDMMACKAAVKAGDPLTGPEIDALLARRDLADRASNCPTAGRRRCVCHWPTWKSSSSGRGFERLVETRRARRARRGYWRLHLFRHFTFLDEMVKAGRAAIAGISSCPSCFNFPRNLTTYARPRSCR